MKNLNIIRYKKDEIKPFFLIKCKESPLPLNKNALILFNLSLSGRV
jgi:hypothetical protein